jgi:hypothetical protein
VDLGICTVQTSAMSRGCFMSYMLVWDPGDFTTYGVLVLAQRDFADDMLGDCSEDTWMIVADMRYWSIEAFPFDTWRLGDHIYFSMISDLRLVIYWMGMILDSECDPLRHYNLWTQSEHDGQMTMIRVAQHQRGGSFMRIAWDPGIGDNAIVDTEARASFFSHEVGSLGEQYIDELIDLLQHRVAFLARGFQEDSYVRTFPDHALSGACFTSYRVVWDSGIIFSVSLDHSMEHVRS